MFLNSMRAIDSVVLMACAIRSIAHKRKKKQGLGEKRKEGKDMKKRNKWLAEDARRYSKIISAKIMEKYDGYSNMARETQMHRDQIHMVVHGAGMVDTTKIEKIAIALDMEKSVLVGMLDVIRKACKRICR